MWALGIFSLLHLLSFSEIKEYIMFTDICFRLLLLFEI